MQKGDEASPSIILAGRALLVKMLITVEPHDIFFLNFVYMICILTLSSQWYEKGDRCLNFVYIYLYFDIVQLLV